MIGTRDSTLIPINGERHTKGMVGASFQAPIAFPWRNAVYGHQMQVSNKPSEHNTNNMPSFRATAVYPRLKQYNGQASKINSANIIFPAQTA